MSFGLNVSLQYRVFTGVTKFYQLMMVLLLQGLVASIVTALMMLVQGCIRRDFLFHCWAGALR